MIKVLKLYNKEGEELTFPSFSAAKRYFGITTEDISKALESGAEYKNYYWNYDYADLPVVGYNLGKPITIEHTPWWQDYSEDSLPQDADKPKIDNRQLLVDIYENSLGIRSAIAHGLYQNSEQLFSHPTNNIDFVPSKNITFDDGMNIFSFTLKELLEHTKWKLNWYVIDCLLKGSYHNCTIQLGENMRAALVEYQSLFVEDYNDPNREI